MLTRHRRRGGRGHLRHSEGSATSPRSSTDLNVTRSLSRRRVAAAAVLWAAGFAPAWRFPPFDVSRRFALFSSDYRRTSAAPLRPQRIASANVHLYCVRIGTHGLLLELCDPVSRLSLLLRASVRRHRSALRISNLTAITATSSRHEAGLPARSPQAVLCFISLSSERLRSDKSETGLDILRFICSALLGDPSRDHRGSGASLLNHRRASSAPTAPTGCCRP